MGVKNVTDERTDKAFLGVGYEKLVGPLGSNKPLAVRPCIHDAVLFSYRPMNKSTYFRSMIYPPCGKFNLLSSRTLGQTGSVMLKCLRSCKLEFFR